MAQSYTVSQCCQCGKHYKTNPRVCFVCSGQKFTLCELGEEAYRQSFAKRCRNCGLESHPDAIFCKSCRHFLVKGASR